MTKNEVDKENKKVVSLDYNNNYDLIDLIPYIVLDKRKTKFIPYSKSESFFSLDYERMNKAVAIGSKYALLALNEKIKISSYTDESYTYYFILLNDDGNFGIVKVKEIEFYEEVLYERIN